MARFKHSKNKIVIIIISILLSIGGIFGAIALFGGFEKDTKEIKSSVFSIGGLDNSGNYVETDTSIYTKDAFECKGLKIEVDFESTVTYAVYFYDEDGFFISFESMTDNFNSELPENARYCRISITPKEDQKVSWYEVNKYAKQLTITVDANQVFDSDVV